MFGPKAVERIQFIKQAQALGLALNEIRQLVGFNGQSRLTQCRQVRPLLPACPTDRAGRAARRAASTCSGADAPDAGVLWSTPAVCMRTVSAGFVIVLLLCPSIAVGQIFGKGARTEFISGFGLRTFASVQERNRLLVDGTAVPDPSEREFRTRVTPVGIVYGLRSTISVIAILPFVDKELSLRDGSVQQTFGGAGGLGDVLFLAKWRFYKRDRGMGTFQLATELGVKAPTGADDLRGIDDQRLPPALQRGSGSWDPTANFLVTSVPTAGRGRWIFTGDVGVTVTTKANDVEVGNQMSYDGMVKYRVHPARYPGRDTFLVFEVNGRWQDQARAGGRPITDSGGHAVYLAPGIQFLLRQNVILEGGVQLPVWQDLNGTQLARGSTLLAGVRYILVP